MTTDRDRCSCGHTVSQHELRTWRFGCFISGCLCLDFDPVSGPVAVTPAECDHEGAPEGRCSHCCPCAECESLRVEASS